MIQESNTTWSVPVPDILLSASLISNFPTDQKEEIHLSASSSRISVREIAARLAIGRIAVYGLLDRGIIPGIKIGRRWLVTRYAFDGWERTCGVRPDESPKPSL
jgi:excisionase family DNA binding protein